MFFERAFAIRAGLGVERVVGERRTVNAKIAVNEKTFERVVVEIVKRDFFFERVNFRLVNNFLRRALANRGAESCADFDSTVVKIRARDVAAGEGEMEIGVEDGEGSLGEGFCCHNKKK